MELDWRHRVLGVVLAVQLLLVPAYRSTDFEVHRNWMAIIHSLPLSKWYIDATSEWTLDYPPLFAWFERALALIARHVDPAMLAVSNLLYDSPATVLFQRLSVSATGLLLAAAMFRATKQDKGNVRGTVLFGLVVANAGLLLVDNIHFQYNGLLLGILLWAVLMVEEGQDLAAASLFAILLNMKHLFLYAAPVFFVYLLRHFCMAVGDAPSIGNSTANNSTGSPGKRRHGSHGNSSGGIAAVLGRLVCMGGIVLAIFAASFAPFIAKGQLRQVLSRLFPFGRGLCHSYWAANAWTLYAFMDKVLAAVLARAGLIQAPPANMAGGLVGVSRFAVLPQIGPRSTAIATLLALSPCLACLWARPKPQRFAAAVAYAGLCGFVWGYHVHEKAALTATIPLALVAVRDAGMGVRYLVLSTAAHVGLMPLLFTWAEAPIKWLMVALYAAATAAGLQALHGGMGKAKAADSSNGTAGVVTRTRAAQLAAGKGGWQVPVVAKLYLAGFVPLEAYCALLHGLLLGKRLPFVPLMLTSVYCALGVLWVWCSMLAGYVQELQESLRPQEAAKQQRQRAQQQVAEARALGTPGSRRGAGKSL